VNKDVCIYDITASMARAYNVYVGAVETIWI